jgi:hypothetical protein
MRFEKSRGVLQVREEILEEGVVRMRGQFVIVVTPFVVIIVGHIENLSAGSAPHKQRTVNIRASFASLPAASL